MNIKISNSKAKCIDQSKLYDIQSNIQNQISVKGHAVLGIAIRVTITLPYSLEVSTSNLTMDILSNQIDPSRVRSLMHRYKSKCKQIQNSVSSQIQGTCFHERIGKMT
jgi:hypothetical protein